LGEPYLRKAFEHPSHATIEHIALDFIFNQIENYGSVEMFSMLIERAVNCKVGILWDIFKLYVTKKLKKLSEPLLMQLVDSLYKRVYI
jgi:hypothetical protein